MNQRETIFFRNNLDSICNTKVDDVMTESKMLCKFNWKALIADSKYKKSNQVFWCELLTIEQENTGIDHRHLNFYQSVAHTYNPLNEASLCEMNE